MEISEIKNHVMSFARGLKLMKPINLNDPSTADKISVWRTCVLSVMASSMVLWNSLMDRYHNKYPGSAVDFPREEWLKEAGFD